MNYFIEDFLFRIAIWKHIMLQYTEALFKTNEEK